MINKLIEKHLNNIDELKEKIKKDIETLFNKLNVTNLLSSPDNTVEVLIFALVERITKKYIKPILKESQGYTKDVIENEKEL